MYDNDNANEPQRYAATEYRRVLTYPSVSVRPQIGTSVNVWGQNGVVIHRRVD